MSSPEYFLTREGHNLSRPITLHNYEGPNMRIALFNVLMYRMGVVRE
jgi:hypothetical protein